MVKVTMKTEGLEAIEYMYEKEFELWKLTNMKHWEQVEVEEVDLHQEMKKEGE